MPPEGVHSDADHRSVRCSPSSHAANLPSRDRDPRFQSRPRLRRLIVKNPCKSVAWGSGRLI